MEFIADMLRARHSAVSAAILTEVAAPLQETKLCMLAESYKVTEWSWMVAKVSLSSAFC